MGYDDPDHPCLAPDGNYATIAARGRSSNAACPGHDPDRNASIAGEGC
jgi:hypothetical protein